MVAPPERRPLSRRALMSSTSHENTPVEGEEAACMLGMGGGDVCLSMPNGLVHDNKPPEVVWWEHLCVLAIHIHGVWSLVNDQGGSAAAQPAEPSEQHHGLHAI